MKIDVSDGDPAVAPRLWSSCIVVASCVAVAIAFWLVPATIEIVEWKNGPPSRVALFASSSRFWGALVAASAVSLAIVLTSADRQSLSRRARAVSPLLLFWVWTVPYWPWLPDQAPALLILARAPRWLMAAAAFAGVVMLPSWQRLRPSLRIPLPSRRSVFAVALVVFGVLGLRSLATIGLGGDEPHYLIITQSLLLDGDLKIENNHARGDYRAFFDGELRPDYLRRGSDGAIYSIHAPGLPALLLPGFAAAGARGAVVTMCAFAALAALAVFDVALSLAGPLPALLVCIAVCFSVPFVPHAWMIYPETASALVVGWAARWFVAPLPIRRASWIARGAALAALPWLHTKFVILLLSLVPFFLWRLRTRVRDAAMFLLPILLSGVGWLAFFFLIYGTINPQAPYGSYPDQFVRLENIPRSVLGLLIDQKFGLLVYTPVYVLAAAGIGLMLRDRSSRAFATMLLAGAIPYLISSARLYMWWGGASAPARFLVPIVPLAAPAIAVALARMPGRLMRATATLTIAFGLTVVCVGVADPVRMLLFSSPHGVARLLETAGSAPLAGALPTFTEEDWRTPLLRAVPWGVAAALALGLAALVASRVRHIATWWTAVTEGLTFTIVGSVLALHVGAASRTDVVTQGRIQLMKAFDPERLHGFDYRRWRRLGPAELIQASALTFDWGPDRTVGEAGQLAPPVELPPGEYEARVWFDGGHSYDGDLMLMDPRGAILERMNGPLPNPATMPFSWPVPVSVSVAVSNPRSARAAQRIEVVARSIVPKSRRIEVEPRAFEPIQGTRRAYIVYLDDSTYPEGGVFWTRGTERGRVLVVGADGATLVVTLHIGTNAGEVALSAAGEERRFRMTANETREVLFQEQGSPDLVAVAVRAERSFRPAAVERGSTDMRALGCQVRISLR